MKKLSMMAAAYKLVWFRVACYFIVPFFVTFLSYTETYSGADWDNLPAFLRARLFATCGLAGLMSLIAFIDNSMGRAKNDLEDRQRAHRTERNPDPTIPTP